MKIVEVEQNRKFVATRTSNTKSIEYTIVQLKNIINVVKIAHSENYVGQPLTPCLHLTDCVLKQTLSALNHPNVISHTDVCSR